MKKQLDFHKNPGAFSLITITLAVILWVACTPSQHTVDGIDSGFMNPPDSAKPRVWWHWMNGNVTKEGIRADLNWMHRADITSAIHQGENKLEIRVTNLWVNRLIGDRQPDPNEKAIK